MNPWPAALMFAVLFALCVLYAFAKFPLLDRLLDALESWLWRRLHAYRDWRADRWFRAGIRYGVKHGIIRRHK